MVYNISMNKVVFDKLNNKIAELEKLINGGAGSGNFGHGGRPGEVGGSSKTGAASKGVKTQQDAAKKAADMNADIEARIGQKLKEGEGITAMDTMSEKRFKILHGKDGTEYTYDKKTGTVTTFKQGNEQVVDKRKKASGKEDKAETELKSMLGKDYDKVQKAKTQQEKDEVARGLLKKKYDALSKESQKISDKMRSLYRAGKYNTKEYDDLGNKSHDIGVEIERVNEQYQDRGGRYRDLID